MARSRPPTHSPLMGGTCATVLLGDVQGGQPRRAFACSAASGLFGFQMKENTMRYLLGEVVAGCAFVVLTLALLFAPYALGYLPEVEAGIVGTLK